jgi:hypothetical protein
VRAFGSGDEIVEAFKVNINILSIYIYLLTKSYLKSFAYVYACTSSLNSSRCIRFFFSL